MIDGTIDCQKINCHSEGGSSALGKDGVMVESNEVINTNPFCSSYNIIDSRPYIRQSKCLKINEQNKR